MILVINLYVMQNNEKKGKIMKKYFLATILMLFVFNAHANNYTGNVNFFLGQKSLKSEDWSPMEDQDAFAVLVDFKQSSWPVSIAIDLLGSSQESTDYGFNFEGTTSEFDIGVRKIWETSGTSIRPYIGGGLAFINAEAKVSYLYASVSDDDTGLGLWLNGGVYWTLGQHFNLGLDLRYSKAEVTVYDVNVEAGGTSAGLILGYHW